MALGVGSTHIILRARVITLVIDAAFLDGAVAVTSAAQETDAAVAGLVCRALGRRDTRYHAHVVDASLPLGTLSVVPAHHPTLAI